MQVEKSFFKLYPLDAELPTFLIINGIAKRINESITNQANEPNNLAIDEKIDAQIRRDFLDDIEIPENKISETLILRIKRYQKIVNLLKEKADYKCQICGNSFLMNNGKHYCEAHHIKLLSKDGSQSPENVIILCANHHREFHYASNTVKVGELIDNKRLIGIRGKQYSVDFDCSINIE